MQYLIRFCLQTVPFIAELSVPIDVGRVILVEGEILPHANRYKD